ncbi:hypothetical protein KZ483_17315 [Paenibacillus sp. sptzw28]|uniref:hypothetical protein n=1 Tax=Paenibacillus sp. sptzw28 TaxID=715179 RepID=UPI001C6E58E2|nr:hypothetical protein [Paenibacillus sp. sptzw28]QYR19649.1 hypothetical protein KZ483_17315 [Paenibacillus sp. sptzw28]
MKPILPSPTPLQTEDEIRMVKEYLVLVVMLDLLEIEVRKLKKLRSGDLRTSRIYIRKLRGIQSGLPKQLHTLHRNFKTHGMRIIEMNRAKGYIDSRYLCRGYEYEMMLQGDTVRAEIEVKLAEEFGVDLAAEYGDDEL